MYAPNKRNEKVLPLTSHWQNGGLSAKLKLSAYYSAECVPHSAFFNNLASVETHRLAVVLN